MSTASVERQRQRVMQKEWTYPYPNLADHALGDNDLPHACPLDNGRHSLNPEYDLGVLDRLPPELLLSMLGTIDLQTLTVFRRVNQRASTVVDSLPQYKAILQNAPNTLRGALSIHTAAHFTCQTLYSALCSKACDICGDFAGYIYLLTCRRVCCICFTQDPTLMPLRRTDARKTYNLSIEALRSVPSMRSIPGRYAPQAKTMRQRITLFDATAVRALLRRQFATEEAMSDFIKRQDVRRDRWSMEPLRFMAMVRTPWLDTGNARLVAGFHCIGCVDQSRDRVRHWRRKFDEESFAEHVAKYGLIHVDHYRGSRHLGESGS